MASTPWYVTREQVKGALDSLDSARNDAQVDAAIEAATGDVEGLLLRRFYPTTTTRSFDWPNRTAYQSANRLWMEEDEVLSVTSLISGGVTIDPSGYFLEPVNSGPPYDRIELNLSASVSFGGAPTSQRAITVTGTFGASKAIRQAGTLAEVLDSSETGIDISDSSAIGVGDLVMVDAEQLIVTGKQMLTTGQTLQAPLAADDSNVTVAVSTGSVYTVGEVILLDSERMLIVDVAGNNLTVKRAYDGSVLASHSGSNIYAPRTLIVERGAVGTTATTHNAGVGLYRNAVPGLVRELTLAEAINNLHQRASGYSIYGVSPTTSDSSLTKVSAVYGAALGDLRTRTLRAHGRQLRTGTV